VLEGERKMFGELRHKIELHNLEKAKLEEEVKRQVTNKEMYSLEDRWSLFVDSDMGNDEIYIEEFGPMNDDFYMICEINRNETVIPANLLDWYETKKFSKDEIKEIKEAILEKFCKSFVYDW
jgi:hypothetical protein